MMTSNTPFCDATKKIVVYFWQKLILSMVDLKFIPPEKGGVFKVAWKNDREIEW